MATLLYEEADKNQIKDLESIEKTVRQQILERLKNMKPEQMGAIRVNVKLTNAVDEELVSRGVLAPALLRSLEFCALVDTGATTLVVPQAIADQLGLRIRRQQVAQYANGFEELIGVTGGVIVECLERQALVEAFVVGNEILIGQIVLEALDLLADCKNQRLIPNPANPDYPVAIIKEIKPCVNSRNT